MTRTDQGAMEAAVEGALAELGTTAREVADTLVAHKIQATIAEGNNCGIAEWLKFRLSAAYVTVAGGKAFVDGVMVLVPAPVAQFMADFDAGTYPELVDPGVPFPPSWADARFRHDYDDEDDDG